MNISESDDEFIKFQFSTIDCHINESNKRLEMLAVKFYIPSQS